MKKIKLIGIAVMVVLSLQNMVVSAESQNIYIENVTRQSEIQPRGRYLLGGGCTITPHNGYVTISGHTDSYDYVSQLTVKLTILKEVSAGCWVAIWSDSVTEYNTYNAGFPSRDVYVESGYNYKVEGTHTVKNAGITETNYSETTGVYVY